jgi:hypothetical protein
MAVVAGVVFFAVRALLALIPGLDRRLSDQEVPVELIILEFGKPVADIVMDLLKQE